MSTHHSDKIKVLFIAGWGRSGSTVLGNALGNIDSFFHVGEIRYIWDRNLIDNRFCGCGQPFDECEVWQAILREAYGRADGVDPQELVRLRENGIRSRHLPLMLMPGGERLFSERLKKSRHGRYPQELSKLYHAIRSVTGCKVIVDSSKFPSYGYVLEMMPDIDLRVIHLVRDPRAVSYSWLRKKLQLDRGEGNVYLEQHSPLESSLLWASWNVSTEMLWRHHKGRYLLLRYEDLVLRPRDALQRILALVGEEDAGLPLIGERQLKVGVNHTVSGNPNRFTTGQVELRPDDEWRIKMKGSDRMLVTALTWPLLFKYGYLH